MTFRRTLRDASRCGGDGWRFSEEQAATEALHRARDRVISRWRGPRKRGEPTAMAAKRDTISAVPCLASDGLANTGVSTGTGRAGLDLHSNRGGRSRGGRDVLVPDVGSCVCAGRVRRWRRRVASGFSHASAGCYRRLADASGRFRAHRACGCEPIHAFDRAHARRWGRSPVPVR